MDDLKYRTPEQYRNWLQAAYEECRAIDAFVASCESTAKHGGFDSREQMFMQMVVYLSDLNRRLLKRLPFEMPAPMIVETSHTAPGR